MSWQTPAWEQDPWGAYAAPGWHRNAWAIPNTWPQQHQQQHHNVWGAQNAWNQYPWGAPPPPPPPRFAGAHLPPPVDGLGVLQGGLPWGSQLLFNEHGNINIIAGDFDPSRAQNQPLICPKTVPLSMTAKELISGQGGGDDWKMTEYYEHGNGQFVAGLECKKGDAQAKKTLRDWGFGRSGVFVWIRAP